MDRFVNRIARLLLRAAAPGRHRHVLALIVAGVVFVVAVIAQAGFVATEQRAQAPAGLATYALTGRVVHVADGDTFTLLSEGRRERIRLASIDAPETTKGRERPGQPMAQVARQALAGMVAGKFLTLTCFERDHYGRSVCDVPLARGGTVNRELVAQGLAWANRQRHGKYLRDPRMAALEASARAARRGLWRDASPVPPWVWRYQCWRHGHC
ncbi:MAG: nuclease [Candidimonas sp.]|nr:MAG: nuclease [Candidimonas sp.]